MKTCWACFPFSRAPGTGATIDLQGQEGVSPSPTAIPTHTAHGQAISKSGSSGEAWRWLYSLQDRGQSQ